MITDRYIPPVNPWDLPALDLQEIMALKALSTGTANAGQQKLALRTIVVKFAGTYDMSFRPGGEDGARASTFAQGKQFVGQRIAEAIDRPVKGQNHAGTGKDRQSEPEA